MNNTSNLQNIAEVSIVYKSNNPMNKKVQIRSSLDINELMQPVFSEFMSHHEEFWIILLSYNNTVLGISKISQGGLAETIIDTRIIFQLALKSNSSKICLCHNHPSGNLMPSTQDQELTRTIVNAGKLMNIEVIDHIILSDGGYYSFADNGML